MSKPERPIVSRSFEVADFEISRSGDGRTVTAYAATFDDPYEVSDVHGHYFETLNRSAFNRTLAHGVSRVKVLANHGMTMHGTPSEKFALPVGTAKEVRPDGKGLLTVTRYAETPLGDEMLELWRTDAITAQSFRGPIYRSAPPRHHGSGLQLIERMELGLIEYGPAVFAVNAGAGLVSIRSQTLTDPVSLLAVDPKDLTDEERAQLVELLSPPAPESAPPADPESTPDPPADPAPVMDPLELAVIEQEQRRRRALLNG